MTPILQAHSTFSDRLDGEFLLRQRTYTGGAVEQLTIDTRTRGIADYAVTPAAAVSPPQVQQMMVSPFTAIDLDRARPPGNVEMNAAQTDHPLWMRPAGIHGRLSR